MTRVFSQYPLIYVCPISVSPHVLYMEPHHDLFFLLSVRILYFQTQSSSTTNFPDFSSGTMVCARVEKQIASPPILSHTLLCEVSKAGFCSVLRTQFIL